MMKYTKKGIIPEPFLPSLKLALEASQEKCPKPSIKKKTVPTRNPLIGLKVLRGQGF